MADITQVAHLRAELSGAAGLFKETAA